ncbi:Cytochrome P450, partial [Macrophomina phaseolina MS6]
MNAPVTIQSAELAKFGLIACGVLLFGVFIFQNISRKHELPLPPQPPGWPLLGNTVDMMKAGRNGELHLQLEKWARQYGEICRVRVGLVTEFFINSDKAVKAIFDKSSACTSERPRWIIAKELFSNSWNVLLLNASDSRWKNQRRIMNTHMSSPQKADAGLP